MTDGIQKGAGTAYKLQAPANLASLCPDFPALVAALAAGEFTVDLKINPPGWDKLGTALNKANLLTDENAQAHGLSLDAVPNDMWAGLVPVGGIIFLAKGTPPDGYLFCDGSSLLISDYSGLYAVIGKLFGGDSTTFKLPDLRNKFLRGISSGKSPTTTLGTAYNATLVPYAYNNNGVEALPTVTASDGDAYTSVSAKGGGDGGYLSRTAYGVRVRPENMGLLPCIKY